MTLSQRLAEFRKERRYRKIRKQFQGQSGLTQQCVSCEFFVYRQEKPRNWVCRPPNGNVNIHGHICYTWKKGRSMLVRVNG